MNFLYNRAFVDTPETVRMKRLTSFAAVGLSMLFLTAEGPLALAATHIPRAIAADPHYDHNITVITWPVGKLPVPHPVDLVWTSQNYHDLHNIPGLNVADFDRAVYQALKPGGIRTRRSCSIPRSAAIRISSSTSFANRSRSPRAWP